MPQYSSLLRQLILAGLYIGALGLPNITNAQQSDIQPTEESTTATALEPRGTTWNFSYENWKLPRHETMGMTSANLLYDVNEHFKLGPGTYGAVRGERGGFITLGLAGQAYQRFSDTWAGHMGLYLGAGGGRSDSSNPLQGGGLMLRSDLGMEYESHGYGNFGLGVSYVDFPLGTIRSWQPYISYSYPFYSLLSSGWDNHSTSSGFKGNDIPHSDSIFGVVVRDYRVASSAKRDDKQPQQNLQLLGAQWQSYLDDRWFLKVEAEGAMGGQSNGYMQVLFGGGYRLPLTSNLALKLYGSAGPAGGGKVDTGGGLLMEGGTSLEANLSKRTSLELMIGEARAPSASFKTDSFGISLNHRFGLPEVSSSNPVLWSDLGNYDQSQMRLRFTSQTYFKDSSNWRSRDTDKPVSNLGGQLDYFITQNWFLTGQGLAAYDGKAGSYMTGLVGTGVHLPLSNSWFLESEALAGAAGGGGLSVGGGLIGQVNASLGYHLTPALSMMATVGHADALRNGNFHVEVAGLTLAYSFESPTAK